MLQCCRGRGRGRGRGRVIVCVLCGYGLYRVLIGEVEQSLGLVWRDPERFSDTIRGFQDN